MKTRYNIKTTGHDFRASFRSFIYSTRGVYLLIAQGVILVLKHAIGSKVAFPLYLGLLAVTVIGQLFRTWAAGFVGTVARGREAYADSLLTAGPYAHVRNPMYLGGLVVTTALSLMSGLWYAPLLAWVAYIFVYSNVIPHEEEYLRKRFNGEYESYFRAVPRLLPSLNAYPLQHGVFSLEEGLANEVIAWTGLAVWALLYWLL